MLRYLSLPLRASRVLTFCLSLFVGVSANSEPYLGFSSFAALSPKFPCDEFLRLLESSPRPAMSVLYGTFGDDWTCVHKFEQRFASRPRLLQVHLSNGSCRRFGRCGEGEIDPGASLVSFKNQLRLSDFQRRVVHVKKKLGSFGENGRYVISIELEDNFSNREFSRLFRVVKREWPFWISRSSVTRNSLRGASDYVERHGDRVACTSTTIWNNDGTPVQTVADYARRTRSCFASFLWTPDLQGSESGFIAPMKRSFRITEESKRRWKTFLSTSLSLS